jgi:hypothetical protein
MNYNAPNANGIPAADTHFHGDASTGWTGFPAVFPAFPGETSLESIVTQFDVTQVPEPGSFGLFCVGLAMVLIRRR